MKSTGIIRKIDALGRIVIPSELRAMLALEEKDSLEIFVEGNNVILRKYETDVDVQNAHDAMQILLERATQEDAALLNEVRKGLRA